MRALRCLTTYRHDALQRTISARVGEGFAFGEIEVRVVWLSRVAVELQIICPQHGERTFLLGAGERSHIGHSSSVRFDGLNRGRRRAKLSVQSNHVDGVLRLLHGPAGQDARQRGRDAAAGPPISGSEP